MNWGYRILFLYLFFVAFMATMVTISVMQTDIHLVAKDYYKQEIAYQSEINKIKNANALHFDSISYSKEKQMLQITLNQPISKGEILFFRPANARKDFRLPLQIDESMTQFISTKAMDKGLWRIKMSWNDANNKLFYFEQKIVIK
jgi:nitrogen fixation protein FixH